VVQVTMETGAETVAVRYVNTKI